MNLPQEEKWSNCFSRVGRVQLLLEGSVPVSLRKPIVTCNFAEASPTLDMPMLTDVEINAKFVNKESISRKP